MRLNPILTLRALLPVSLRQSVGRGRRALRFAKRRRRIRFRLANRHVKLLFPSQAGGVAAEALARSACKAAPWNSVCCIIPTSWNLPLGFVLQVSPHHDGRPPSLEEAIRLSNQLIQNIPHDCPQAPAIELIHPKLQDFLRSEENMPEARWLVEELMNLHLPITGAHGDLNKPNMISGKDGFAVIDFETFRTRGSIIEDITRLISSLVKKTKQSDIRDIVASAPLNGIEFKINITNHLILYLASESGCQLDLAQPRNFREEFTRRCREIMILCTDSATAGKLVS